MSEDCNDVQITLAKLRQGALLLSFANGYLCKPPFLKKIGREMDRALQALPSQIESLKSRFPGKFETDVDTEPLMVELNRMVEQLGDAEADITARCSQGGLGPALELAISDLASALNTITAKVEGRPAANSPSSGLATHLVRSTSFMSGLSRKVVTVLLPLAVIGVVLFGYFFFTMEGDQEIRNQIAVLEAKVHSSRTILAEIERQRDQLSHRMDSMRGKELLRPEKIELIDLGQELQGVRERQLKAETEIQSCGEEVERLNAKLKAVERKSFLERLLRL